MKTYNNSVVLRNDGTDPSTNNDDMNAGVGVNITVRVASTPTAGQGALASIFDVADVAIANPMQTDNQGNYTFKVADGLYDIVIAEGTADEKILASEEIVELVTPDFINNLSLPYVFDTVADMVASVITFPLGKVLVTKGYFSGGDDGGMSYTVITEASFPYGDKYKFDGVFHHLTNGNMVEPILANNRLTDSQCGVVKSDSTKRTQNVAAWNNGSFCCKAFGWTFVSSGVIHTNNTLFIESFSDIEFRGRCEIIHDDIQVNEFGDKDILASYPKSIYHKSFIDLTGTVLLRYVRADETLSTGNGFNMGNAANWNMEGFECRVFDAELAVYGHSIVEMAGGTFQANRCYMGMQFLPDLGVDSEAAASTAFNFKIVVNDGVHGFKMGTVYYGAITGWVDTNKADSPRLKPGDMPLAMWCLNDCQKFSIHNFGFEQNDGMALRVEEGSIVDLQLSNVALDSDIFQTDPSFQNQVPAKEQAWISVAANAVLNITDISVLLKFVPVTDSYILNMGKGARVNIDAGRLGFDGAGPKMSFVRGDVTHLKTGNIRNLPTGWASGYEYHGNNKGTFTGNATTDAGGLVTVDLGVFEDVTGVTDGATGAISVSSIDGLFIGQKITVSAGFPNVPLTIVSVDFGTKITVDVNSTSAETGVTVKGESIISQNFFDVDNMAIQAISTTVGSIVSYGSLTHNSIQFKVSPPAPVDIRYSVTAIVD